MTSSSLSSASNYLNNLLLARGLLQDGKSIDFAQPERDDTTMSRVINIVHDLVLRRDRDAEQREILAHNIHAMRVEESQRVLDMQRVQDKNTDLVRKMKEADAQERALKASLRKAESAAKDLKEQTLKMKSTLDQVRAKCLGDVRKRDLEIEKLQKHVATMQRGQRGANPVPKVVTINKMDSIRGGQEVNSAELGLEQESNEFLTALLNETSGENVTMRRILTETLETLREMTGSEEESKDETEVDGIGIPGQYRKSRQKAAEKDQEAALISCETLAKNISAALDHCRSILRDPSFVPIEEVHVREVEIMKLRDGWEKMASRWKEAVTMMETWRQNMLAGSPEKIDMNELSQLEFGRSVAVLPDGKPVLSREEIYSSILMDSSRIEVPKEEVDDDADAERQKRTHEDFLSRSNVPRLFPEDDESFHPDDDEPSPKRLAVSPKRGMRLPRPAVALAETDGNPGARTTSAEEEAVEAMLSHSGDSGIGSLDGSAAEGADENDTFAGRHLLQSRIPRQPKSTLPALTVSQKLAAIEAEAKEAEEERHRQQEAVTQKRKVPAKRKGDNLRRSRRRSTLAPEELAELMGFR